MYTQEEMLKQCPKPIGDIGRFVGIKMNENGKHFELWKWGLSQISINEDDTILDVGCGGGAAITLLASQIKNGKIFGLDHSEEMVKLAKEINHDLILRNIVQIIHGSVSKLPFQNNSFNLVTAFETYGFWPDIINDFNEINRVMKPGGIFLLVNSAYKHDKFEERNSYWHNLFNLRIDTPDELNEMLSKTGFISVKITEVAKNNWITAVAKKKESP